MKLWTKFMLITGLLALILAGCGTSQNAGDSNNGSEEPQKEEENSQDQGSIEDDDNSQNQEDTNSEEESGNNDGVRVPEQKIKYTENGNSNEETAFLKHNDNQNYSMYVLPNYELTAEEPNKDILYLTENDQIFMRIELLPEDTEWKMIEDTTKSQLGAVNEDVQTLESPSDEFFNNTTVMEASKDGETVTAYLVKNETQQLKLTIFTKEGYDYKDAFLQMAKTIMKESSAS